MPDEPYNPLDYKNLTASVVRELVARDPVVLPLVERFPGPGVYALFYNGPLPFYASVASPEWAWPIYVGKAILPGGRKGGRKKAKPVVDMAKPALFGRIAQHVRSIRAADNLDLDDFRCRYLTVIPLWITMAERFLIEHYRPVWNVCVEGFGIHNPGKGRHEGEIPWWDALHPGRTWATRLKQTRTQEQAVEFLTHCLGAEEARKAPPK